MYMAKKGGLKICVRIIQRANIKTNVDPIEAIQYCGIREPGAKRNEISNVFL